jgi:hypothetical protein
MRRARAVVVLAVAGLSLGCQPEAHVEQHQAVKPPVDSPGAIPDAPLSGTLRATKFVVKDARYVADHRVGYLRTDIKLSAGSAETACGEIKPAGSPSVWLRLERSDQVDTQELRLTPGQESPWSVHYQIRENEAWVGSADAAVVATIRASAGDGVISGALAVCFADDAQSCVSGSFEALPCPFVIDAPVRGALPQEHVPEKYAPKLRPLPLAPPH